MKKTTRTLLGIGGAFCLIGALLFGIGFVSGGTKYVHATNLNTMNAQSDQDAKENHFTLEKTELSDFNSLNINLKNSDFNIKESPNEKSYIEYVQETTKAEKPSLLFHKESYINFKREWKHWSFLHCFCRYQFFATSSFGKKYGFLHGRKVQL